MDNFFGRTKWCILKGWKRYIDVAVFLGNDKNVGFLIEFTDDRIERFRKDNHPVARF